MFSSLFIERCFTEGRLFLREIAWNVNVSLIIIRSLFAAERNIFKQTVALFFSPWCSFLFFIHLSSLVATYFPWPLQPPWVATHCMWLLPAWLRSAIHGRASKSSPRWLCDIQEVPHLRNGCGRRRASWIRNSVSVTLTYPAPSCRLSNNRIQRGMSFM